MTTLPTPAYILAPTTAVVFCKGGIGDLAIAFPTPNAPPTITPVNPILLAILLPACLSLTWTCPYSFTLVFTWVPISLFISPTFKIMFELSHADKKHISMINKSILIKQRICI